MWAKQNQVQDNAASPPVATGRALPVISAATAIAIFILDTVTPAELIVAVLYVGVVLLSARFLEKRGIAFVALGCMALTVLSYFLSRHDASLSVTLSNRVLSLAAVGVTAFLAVQSQSRETVLREQAGLLDLTHDTMFVRDTNDVIIYWNRGAEDLYAWRSEEAVGKTTHQLMQTIFPRPLEEITAELLRTGRWAGELVHTKKDGTQAVVASRWSVQRDVRGRPVAILETNNDITERKRAEDALRESEARYRYIFDTAGVSIWEEDFSGVKAATDELKAQGIGDFRAHFAAHPEFVQQAISMVKIIDVNDATIRLFRAESKEEMLGSLNAIFTPETQEAFVGELLAIAEGRPFYAAETTVRTLKGDKRAVLFTITFRPQPDKLDRVLVTIMDITQRKRAEILTAQVFERAPDGICIVGKDYRYQRANPVYARRWGIPAEQIVGMHVSELLGVDPFERILKPNLDRCFAGEEATFEWLSESRGPLYLAVSYSPLRSGSEDVEAALVIQRNLTEYMRASEELRAAQAELAHVNRVATMGQLTASIAHEVNQPIAAAVTNAQTAMRWLETRPPSLEAARQALGRIVENGKRASEVTGRIRALIKKAPGRKDQVDLNQTVLEVIALTRSEVLRHDISLQTRLAEDLPLIAGDRIQLQQVILNLILNAVQAMSDNDEGVRELQVWTERNAAGGVLVSVRDSGPGLDPMSVDRLFEAFYTTKPDGMGMGLAICRSIIEAHGGQIGAFSSDAGGALFRFNLPADRDEAVLAEQAGPIPVM